MNPLNPTTDVPHNAPARPAIWPSYAALALTLLAVPAYVWLLDIPMLRSTGIVAFAILALGAAIGLARAARDRRWKVRVPAGVNVALLALWTIGFFVRARLPVPQRADLTAAPEFRLLDHHRRPVSLREACAAGPILLVFYRGHW